MDEQKCLPNFLYFSFTILTKSLLIWIQHSLYTVDSRSLYLRSFARLWPLTSNLIVNVSIVKWKAAHGITQLGFEMCTEPGNIRARRKVGGREWRDVSLSAMYTMDMQDKSVSNYWWHKD